MLITLSIKNVDELRLCMHILTSAREKAQLWAKNSALKMQIKRAHCSTYNVFMHQIASFPYRKLKKITGERHNPLLNQIPPTELARK